ncbi:MAG: hypothetical protein HFE82_07635 [Erysipelotrichaceae bacterium]|nr:hypothetical protein [Erysipelotrichaceae bacterium]
MLEIIVGAVCIISIVVICYGVGIVSDTVGMTDSDNAVEAVVNGFTMIVFVAIVLAIAYIVGEVLLK